MRSFIVSVCLCSVGLLPHHGLAQTSGESQIERLSKLGQTLPVEVTAEYPLAEQRVDHDTGVNVLVDLAHQASFFTMWSLPGELRRNGFRASGSQATLNSVLAADGCSRVRLSVAGRRPFAWLPNPKWNVVLTYQGSTKSPQYLPEEREVLKKFVQDGGGLIVGGSNVFDQEQIDQWSLNHLLGDYGIGLSATSDRAEGKRISTLDPDAAWEVVRQGEEGRPLVARRTFGKGRVVVFSSAQLLFWDRKAADADAPNSLANRRPVVKETVQWAAGGAPPVAGSRRLPSEASGGGPIYPELEQNVGGVIVYYGKNQTEELLDAVRQDMPKAKKQVEAWLPSVKPDEPMYLIISAGGGGGWAVNAYLPKETGVISLSPAGLLSVFGHEMAHTMGGPPNQNGEVAASWAHGNRGESHAGWFQGKVIAMFGDDAVRAESNRNCNRFFQFDKTGSELDLALSREEMSETWGKGKEWTKIWWVWQKLDDRYGPTWYPRWRWVQHTRWQDQPTKRLSWDEVVEDMSIAVGEDLFPFFTAIGTTLDKRRLPTAQFNGETLTLPVAPLTVTPAGPVRLEPIGDYKQPLNYGDFDAVTVFENGKDGYKIFRIPAIVTAANGDILAFCEARVGGDLSEIDLVLKRSADGGKTWQGLEVVQENDEFRGLFENKETQVSIGNPAPVVDLLDPKHPGRIWLPFSMENDRVFVTYSDDHGGTWAKPREITSDVKKDNWGWYATGPVHSIQLQRGKYKGRLVIPCDHRIGTDGHDQGALGAHALLSDDHGKTWRLGAIDDTYDDGVNSNETTVVELNDGRLYFNTRNHGGEAEGTRGGAYSSDGGESYDRSPDAAYTYFVPSPTQLDPPVVQCSVLRAASTADGDERNLLLFSGPDENGPTGKGRSDLRIRYSTDESATWHDGPLLHEGPAAYSDMIRLGADEYGVLFEAGKKDHKKYDTIVFVRVTQDDLKLK